LPAVIAHPLAAAGDVIGMFREFATELSDDATVYCGLTHAPDGSGMKLCAIALCHAGAIAEAEAELRPLREFGPPAMDLVAPMPYPAVNTMLDNGFPRGALNYWRSAFFTELSDAAVQTLLDAYEAVPSPMTPIFIEHYHGAACRVDPTATAFPHREPGFNLILPGQWADPADTEVNVRWVRDTFAALEPYTAPRTLVNYAGSDQADESVAFYGSNLDRLRDTKRRYDPDNVFHLNQNIRPA
jgi:FAD/FMN-containing dehydrogenase